MILMYFFQFKVEETKLKKSDLERIQNNLDKMEIEEVKEKLAEAEM